MFQFTTRKQLWLGLGLLLLILSYISYSAYTRMNEVSDLLSRRILNPINELRNKMDIIGNDRDLSIRVDVFNLDEIRYAVNDFNHMHDQLNETVQGVDTSVGELSEVVSRVNISSDHISQSANRQASNVEEAVCALDKMSTSITQNTEKTKKAEGIAKQSNINPLIKAWPS